jgi:hypothetical protein
LLALFLGLSGEKVNQENRHCDDKAYRKQAEQTNIRAEQKFPCHNKLAF